MQTGTCGANASHNLTEVSATLQQEYIFLTTVSLVSQIATKC